MQPTGTNPFAPFPTIPLTDEPFDLYIFIERLTQENTTHINEVLKSYFDGENKEGFIAGAHALTRLWESSLLLDDKRVILNLFINHFPRDFLLSFFKILVIELTPETIAKVISLVTDNELVELLIVEFIGYYLEKHGDIPETEEERINAIIEELELFAGYITASQSNLNEEVANAFHRFIEGASETLDFEHPKPLSILTILFEELERLKLIHTILCERFEMFDEFGQICILLSLSQRCLKSFIEGFDSDSNPYKLPTLQNKLFLLQTLHTDKLAIVSLFINALPEDSTEEFIEILIEINSPCLPYIPIVLCDEDFDAFCSEFNDTLLSNLLRRSLPELCGVSQWILNQLEQKNRIVPFCENAELDIVSQDFIIIGGMACGTQLTLQRTCEYIEENRDQLENFMKTFQQDLNQIPPFLLAVGMRAFAYREPILSVRMFLSDEQLIGVVHGLSEFDYPDILEVLLTDIRIDQMRLIIRNLYFRFFDSYLDKITATLSEKMEMILSCHIKLRTRFMGVKADEEEYLLLQEETFQQLGRLKAILIPVYYQVNTRCRLTNKNHPLSDILTECEALLSDIEGQEGFYQKLKEWEPKKPEESHDFLHSFESENDITIKELSNYGIYSDADCKFLGFKLQEYLEQKNLDEVWKFLKTKHLTSIQSLFEFCCIETEDELMSLEEVAKKMGFVLKIN